MNSRLRIRLILMAGTVIVAFSPLYLTAYQDEENLPNSSAVLLLAGVLAEFAVILYLES